MVLAGIALVFQAGFATAKRDEVKARLLFVLGGYLGFALLMTLDALTVDLFRVWLRDAGPIVYDGY